MNGRARFSPRRLRAPGSDLDSDPWVTPRERPRRLRALQELRELTKENKGEESIHSLPNFFVEGLSIPFPLKDWFYCGKDSISTHTAGYKSPIWAAEQGHGTRKKDHIPLQQQKISTWLTPTRLVGNEESLRSIGPEASPCPFDRTLEFSITTGLGSPTCHSPPCIPTHRIEWISSPDPISGKTDLAPQAKEQQSLLAIYHILVTYRVEKKDHHFACSLGRPYLVCL